jgi:Zn-dependent peptidase ImmA (M78 family)
MIDLKTETAKRLERKLDVSSDITLVLFDIGLIDERTAKRFLVKDDFENKCPKQGEKEESLIHIADDYCVSLETAKRYITGRYK